MGFEKYIPYIPLIFVVVVIIYFSLNQDELIKFNDYIQDNLNKQPQKEPEQQIIKNPEQQSEPVDCVGEWKDIEACKIDRCDPNKPNRGLGTKKQKFEIKVEPKNNGRKCEGPFREIDCSEDRYIGCTQCGGANGRYTEGANCTNINYCDGTRGYGERIDKWSFSEADRLPNCVAPEDQPVSCYIENYDRCICSYDISSNTTCDDKNAKITCEGGSSTCTLNYSITNALPGGVCPAPDHNKIFFTKPDQRCECLFTTLDNNIWDYSQGNGRCLIDSTTLLAENRSRRRTIRKTGGLSACTIPRSTFGINQCIVDTNTNKCIDTSGNNHKAIYLNDKFQFSPNNDIIGSTFDIIETENNIVRYDDNLCKCEVTNWAPLCPDPNDTTLLDSDFNIIQKGSCLGIKRTRTIQCPRNCSGTLNVGDCDKDKGTRTNRFIINKDKLGNGDACPAEYTELCDVDCEGEWEDIEACKIDNCDPNIRGRGLGKKRQKFEIKVEPKNNGRKCDGPFREKDCSEDRYIGCTRCGGAEGEYTTGANCTNINFCDGTRGYGEREDVWSFSADSSLNNCFTPPSQFVSCDIENYYECTCRYDISSNTTCDDKNAKIRCEGGSSICTLDYSIKKALPGGVCPAPDHNKIFFTKPDQRCNCLFDTSDNNKWDYSQGKGECLTNSTTLLADNRSRRRTIRKTGGLSACTIPRSTFGINQCIVDTNTNKCIDTTGNIDTNGNMIIKDSTQKAIYLNDKFQFSPNNDIIGATFDIIETENDITRLDDDLCKCEVTNWEPLCPNRKNTTLPPSSFNITQTGSCLGIKRTRTIQCPRDCSGNYTDWVENPNNPVCPSKTDYSISDNSFNIIRNRTRTFNIKVPVLNDGTCAEANTSNTNQTYDFTCPRDCSGNWISTGSGCSAVCPGNGLDNYGTSTVNRNNDPATEMKVFDLFKKNLGTGVACPTETRIFDSCSIPCKIDCVGEWSAPFGCTAKCAPSDSNEATTEKTGEQFKDWINPKGPFNGGKDCPTRTKEICSVSNCPVDCLGNWNETTACNATCPGNANYENGGISSGIIENIFRITRDKNSIGRSCTNQNGERRKKSDCTKPCDLNCIGNWGPHYYEHCCPFIYGKLINQPCNKRQDWVNSKGPFHHGNPCPGTTITPGAVTCTGSKDRFRIKWNNPWGHENKLWGFNSQGGQNQRTAIIPYAGDYVIFNIDSNGILSNANYPDYKVFIENKEKLILTTASDSNGCELLTCYIETSTSRIFCRNGSNTIYGYITSSSSEFNDPGPYQHLKLSKNNGDTFYFENV